MNSSLNLENIFHDSINQRKATVFHNGDLSLKNNKPIEKISHHIWLSNHVNNGKSKEINDDDFQSLIKQINRLDNDNNNFKHILWVNDLKLIPTTISKVQELKNVDIKNIESLNKDVASINKIKECLENGIYGIAIDAVKYEVVRLFGGIVLDLNYNITTESNIIDILNSYSFIAGGNIGYGRINIENSLIAASKNHPILKAICDKVTYNLEITNIFNNIGDTDRFYKYLSEEVLSHIDPYSEEYPAEIYNNEGRASSPEKELLGQDHHSNSWVKNVEL